MNQRNLNGQWILHAEYKRYKAMGGRLSPQAWNTRQHSDEQVATLAGLL